REGQDTWKSMGVPPGTISNMSKFEAADPGFWCHNGYAIANVDPRGVGHSEGNVHLWGTRDGQDGYDFIEWAAQQSWCNGRCAMYGNSGVCMVQWRIAAEAPPHLACFAAWEGTGDLYRESVCLGGIPSYQFEHWITSSIAADGSYVEDNASMLKLHPLMDKFWENKIPNWRNIKAPAYICCGMCHPCHLRGSLEGFRRIRSPKRWIRIHREHEWPDAELPENLQDLKRFYDRYLKDIHNGWEMTPKVRLDVMDSYDYNWKSQRPENEFPLARTQYTKLYLNAADGTLNDEPVAVESETVYDPETGVATYVYRFKEETEISGYLRMHLFLEARDYDNMDIMTWVTKYKEDGTYVPLRLIGCEHRGTYSFYRASHRELDPKWTTAFQPVQAHRKVEPMIPGEVYECDIEILATSRVWHKGEELHLEITGHLVPCGQPNPPRPVAWDNEGRHVIHTGGKYDSYLVVPIAPPKYQSGDYKYYD
ncbi:MAG: CocE/NonD family hydrolase, partial [Oscillospiraceae bacterium]|nr:CocE/NonD family hydrolase [Oscillospiraceae bacterium]